MYKHLIVYILLLHECDKTAHKQIWLDFGYLESLKRKG